jgi:ferric-dicitrate binding protein FerR (iron transport regulator)
MNFISSKRRAREKGWALIAVMSLAATALLMVASVMSWANENATVVARRGGHGEGIGGDGA